MQGRVLEITQDGLYLRAKFGLLEVYKVKKEFAEKIDYCPIADISALILVSKRIRFDVELFYLLSAQGAVVVFCDNKYMPTGVVHPLNTNFEQAKRLDFQLNATRPLKKKVWAHLVKEKIMGQASVLYLLNKNYAVLKRLAEEVRAGDESNCEAVAAAHYWKELFGKDFVRERNSPGINGLLNYGYTVFRAGMARCIVASGLNPNISVFHKNENNAYRLVDDLMEPFRPIIDLKVLVLTKKFIDCDINKHTKKELADCLYIDLVYNKENTPVFNGMHKLCLSLVKIYAAQAESLDFPEKRLPKTLIEDYRCYQDIK